MDFKERLIEYMNAHNYRQADIVKLCKSDKGTVSGLVNGKRTPNIEFLIQLSRISNKSINWWLGDTTSSNTLSTLNDIVDLFIENGTIGEDATIDDDIKHILFITLKTEIKEKIKLRNFIKGNE